MKKRLKSVLFGILAPTGPRSKSIVFALLLTATFSVSADEKQTDQAAKQNKSGAKDNTAELLKSVLESNRQLVETNRELAKALAHFLQEKADKAPAGATPAPKELHREITKAAQARDESFKKVVELTDKLQASQASMSALLAKVKALEQKVKAQQAEIAKLRSGKADAPEKKLPEKKLAVQGVVTAVGEKDYIEISVGSDDGIRVGTKINISREQNFIAAASVLKTTADRSVAKVIKATKRGLVKEHDRIWVGSLRD